MRSIAFAGAALIILAAVGAGPASSQKGPKTCSEAQNACVLQKAGTLKDCGAQKDWCMKTGSFEDPKTKAVSMDLQKK